jgi:catechol 2,3-dioxygenase-like lactoylglutathione lyase family enzyme
MKNKLMFGVLVKNYDEAIDFYTKKLGFVVLEDNPMGDDRWVKMTRPYWANKAAATHILQWRPTIASATTSG